MSGLLLGTRNEGKIEEAKELLSDVVGLELLTFADVPFSEVPETGRTFLDNALLKAKAICRETGRATLSEDAGLEVTALGGVPGVRSARFAGEPRDPQANNLLLLDRLKSVTDRRARFVTTAALCLPDGQTFVCSGTLRGTIGNAPSGSGGFGYDPLFIPDGFARTLAAMGLEEKNRLSHRFKALTRMKGILLDLIRTGELSRPA